MLAGSLFQGEKARKVAILLPGIPGSLFSDRSELVKKLVKDRFVIIAPEYFGTYSSGGRFTFENAVESVLLVIEALEKSESFYDIWTRKKFNVKPRNKILLLGGSFGASVALVACAKSRLANHVIAISTQATFRKSQESNREMLRIMEEGFPHIYRSDASSRKRFERGSVDLNAIEYATELGRKNVLLIHGMKDDIVRYRQSLKLYQRILKEKGGRKQVILLEDRGHSGGSLAGEGDIYPKVRRWLEETGMS